MNNQDYEKARQECGDALRKELLKDEIQWEPVSRKEIFNFAFDRAYALGKQEKDADTVIQGWMGRDKDGFISLFLYRPDRVIHDDLGYWGYDDNRYEIDIPQSLFPDLTWDDEPIEVEIIIKRKKK